MAVAYMQIRFTVSFDFDGNAVFLHFPFFRFSELVTLLFCAKKQEIIPDTEMHYNACCRNYITLPVL